MTDQDLEQQLEHSVTMLRHQQQRQVEAHVERLLQALKLDPQSEHFAETPRRVAKMLLGFRRDDDLNEIIATGFEHPETKSGLLIQKHIPFKGLCAHHLVPFWGEASVGYIPKSRIVGLSKLTRLVQAAGELSPSTQEEITNTVADRLYHGLDAQGVAVVSDAAHGCMAVRGVNSPTTTTTYSAMRGLFLHSPAARDEFLRLYTGGR